MHYEDFATNFTNAARTFINFVNASSADDETKLLKSMEACQERAKTGGRRLLSQALQLPLEASSLPVCGRYLCIQCASLQSCAANAGGEAGGW